MTFTHAVFSIQQLDLHFFRRSLFLFSAADPLRWRHTCSCNRRFPTEDFIVMQFPWPYPYVPPPQQAHQPPVFPIPQHKRSHITLLPPCRRNQHGLLRSHLSFSQHSLQHFLHLHTQHLPFLSPTVTLRRKPLTLRLTELNLPELMVVVWLCRSWLRFKVVMEE